MDGRDDKAEIELKLAIAPEALTRLSRDPRLKTLVGGTGAVRRHLRTTYFDTADGRLKAAALALRVRRDGRRRVQTLKSAAHPDPALGPLARGEWEREIVGEAPVIDEAWLAEIGDKAARKILAKPKVRFRLKPLFSTDFRRQTWLVERDGSVIELAIDRGTIAGRNADRPISEIELELKSGHPDAVYALAREIVELAPAFVERRSKAERGYVLSTAAREAGPRAVRAAPVRLARGISTATAFREIGRSCLAHARANETLLRDGPFVEGVHQFRVALRRLRSALAAFRDVLPADDRERKSELLRGVAGSFGDARDWDVFRTDLLKPLARHLRNEPGLARVTRAADRARAKAYAKVEATLADRNMTAAMLETEAWLERGDWAAAMGAGADLPARDFARTTLRRLHRKVAGIGHDIAGLPEDELHELRIRCKKLRYAAEFFRSLFPRKSADAFVAALADVQEHLGALNDSLVATRLMGELGAGKGHLPAALLARAEGIVAGWLAARVRADLDELPEVWRRFDACRPFWK
jgi:triphosphatase